MKTAMKASRLARAVAVAVAMAMAAAPACTLPLVTDPPPPTPPAAVARSADDVIVNGALLTAEELARFERLYGMRVPPGAYWYDSRSGAWGRQGGPTVGVTRAGVAVAGSLRADASGGGDGNLTGIYINGREIHQDEAALLAQYVELVPGRYWIDADGNAGIQGLPAMVNLKEEARSRGADDPLPDAHGGYPAADGLAPYFFEPAPGVVAAPPAAEAEAETEAEAGTGAPGDPDSELDPDPDPEP